jgi:hypothetical protein
MLLNKKVFIFDTKTFTILDSYSLQIYEKKTKMPFYTRVEEIKVQLT